MRKYLVGIALNIIGFLALFPIIVIAQTVQPVGTVKGGSGGSINAGSTVISGGTNTRVIFNDSGVWGEDADFTWDKTNNDLTVASQFIAGVGTVGAPSFRATDTDTGFNIPVAGQAGIVTNSILRLNATDTQVTLAVPIVSNTDGVHDLGTTALNWGQLWLDATLTTAGTTGAQTINKNLGQVNFAAAATTLVVTNSRVTTTSFIFTTPQTSDTTCKSFAVTRAAGSFTLTANAACTAETAVAFLVMAN